MRTMNATIQTLGAMFGLLLGLGWLLRRTGVLTEPYTTWLTNFITIVPLPALVMGALAQARFSPALLGVWLLGLLITGVGMGLAWLLGKWLGLRAGTLGVLMVSGTLGNTGFLGTPLIAALYPHQPDVVAAAVTFDMGVTALMVNTVGIAILAHFGKGDRFDLRRSLKRLLQMPVLWATWIGYAVMLSGLKLPAPLLFTLERLGQTTVPLALLAIGSLIRWHAIGTRWRALLLIVAFKCLLMPSLCWGLLQLVALPEFAARALLLQSAMPSVMVSAVYAALYKTEPDLAAAVVAVSTLLFFLLWLPLF